MILSGPNSRTSPRHTALENYARLEWWQGDRVYDSPARLVNISEGGALLIVEKSPPLEQTIWCRLEEPTPTDWIRANVVRHGDPREIALTFPASCPFDFSLAATLGLNFDSLFRVPR
jgi:PilZ domain